jgi:oleandomycin transport system permease protein
MTSMTRTADTAPRVRLRDALGHSFTLTWRSLLQIKADPEEVIGLTLQPIMFVLLFVYIFGGAISGNPDAYLQFALPGILVQTVMFATLATGFSLNTDITKGIFDRFRSLPIARSAPLVGRVLGDVVRYTISVLVILGIGFLLGFRVETGVLFTVAALGLTLAFALAICWISCLVGLLVRTPQAVQQFGFIFMFPLTFASEVFVPAKTMPDWLRGWVEVNPVSLLSEAILGLLNGGAVLTPTLATIAWGIGIIAVFGPLSAWAYRRRV